MSVELTESNRSWLEHDGKVVLIEGRPHRIKCSIWTAKYPYAHTAMDVSAEMVDKSDHYYLENRSKLGDEWLVDLLASDPEFMAPILAQLTKKTA